MNIKLLIGATVLALSMSSYAAERTVTCKMSNANGEISATVGLSAAETYEGAESSGNGLDAGKSDNYSFYLEMRKDEKKKNNYETRITFYENNNVVDEVGSMSCRFNANAKSRKVICTEPMESEDGVVADFECVRDAAVK